MFKLNVPYHSQYDPSIPEEWRPRSCGIAALHMALSVKHPGVCQTWDLIQEGLAVGAYKQGVGWVHSGLVNLAKAHNATGTYRKEFRSWFWKTFSGASTYYLMRALKNGKVPIVSLTVAGKTDTHLVPLIGYDNTGFYYHEPAAHSEAEGASHFISYTDFCIRFRRLAIFVH